MKITKKHLDEMYRAYATSSMNIDGDLHIMVASEEKGGPCYTYWGDDFQFRQEVWNNAGGCMSIVPIPGKENEFLAVQEFYLKESPSQAKIVWGKYNKDNYIIKDLFKLPFIHRFDIYHVNGINYFIGATIAHDKQDKEDWSQPGKIYVAELPDDFTQPLKLEVLQDGLVRNHGYCKRVVDGVTKGYFASDMGIYEVTPPLNMGNEWQVQKLMDGRISEVAFIDIDNDGVDELMTIEPFHGNIIKIYKFIDNKYQEVYVYPHKIDFAHTIVGGKIRGVNTFVGGIRREEADLFMVQYIGGQFVTTIIDKGVGPANVAIVNEGNRDLIISANHTVNEAAVYYVED